MFEEATQSRLAVLLFTDVVGSTEAKSRLGTAAYTKLLARHNELFETLSRTFARAQVLKHTGDGYFAAFETASDAVRFALLFQHAMRTCDWAGSPLATRVGIHVGEVAIVKMADRDDVVGLAADLAARVMSLASGGQILLTREAFNNARQFIDAFPALPSLSPGERTAEGATAEQVPPPTLKWLAHGPYLFKGTDEPVEVFEVGAEGLAPLSPPQNTDKAKRVVPHEQEPTLGWRPAVGLEVPGRVGWKLERKLGEGGFGEVWLARHERTKQRRVFKFCFDADRLRSFKRELTLFRLLKEALGDRPDIAKLYDVKLDEPPFFLESEYTEGGDLADWAERRGGIDKLPVANRLEVFAQIADAVAAAHSVGILHKDLKPSNVLINEARDGSIQPRITDFGIGILTNRAVLGQFSITAMGTETMLTANESSRTGTRMYAPPESLQNKPFTVQGDVYALGVILYQLVVGDLTRPLAAGWEREINDDVLRDDITACVERDLASRLPTANAVAHRVRTLEPRRQQRRQAREAEARSRRRRLQWRAAVAALAMLGLLGGILTIALVRERNLRVQLAAQKNAAEQRRDEAQAVSKFLTDRVFAGATPERLPSRVVRDAIVKAMLDPAAEAVAQDFRGKPLTEAAVRDSLALSYLAIGRTDLGLPHAETALLLRRRVQGDNHPDTAASISNLALLFASQQKLPEAEQLHRELLQHRRRQLGNDDPETLHLMTSLGALLEAQGKLAEAEPLYREAMDRSRRVHGGDHTATLIAINNFGMLLQRRGKLSEAEPLLREALQLSRSVLGDDDSLKLALINNVGFVLRSRGKLAEAEPLYREALERTRRVWGDDHPNTLRSINNLGYLLQAQGRPVEAEPLFAELYRTVPRSQVLPQNAASFMSSYGLCLTGLGRHAEAAEPLRVAYERLRETGQQKHPEFKLVLQSLIEVSDALGRPGEADQWRAELAAFEGANRPSTAPATGSAN